MRRASLTTPSAGKRGTASVQFVDRTREMAALDALLEAVRLGMSGKLILRGEPGIGKTALLEHAVATASDFRVVRAVGIESEMELGFAGLHQVVVPFLMQLDQLPPPQQKALGAAFGLVSGEPPERFQVGLATLTLLARAAEEKPLLYVIDDAHWLDIESAEVLAFVARRLYADRVAILFGIREGSERESAFGGIPELRVQPLATEDARRLLASVIAGSAASEVSNRFIIETAGNPLAILELAPATTPSAVTAAPQFDEPPPVHSRLQQHFLSKVRALPAKTQTFLQLASADSSTDPVVLWHAAKLLAIDREAIAPAESERLIAVGPRIAFRHPLIRSAIYHGMLPAQRRMMHSTLADAIDPQVDPDRHAEHQALSALEPDEEIAQELLKAAERAKQRGAYAAWSRYASKAAELTPDRKVRAPRLLDAAEALLNSGQPGEAQVALDDALTALDDPLQRGAAKLIEGLIRIARAEGSETPRFLLETARDLRSVDVGQARDALHSAVLAAILIEPMPVVLEEIAKLARAIPPRDPASPSIDDLLLDGTAGMIVGDFPAAVPMVRRAFDRLLAEALDPQVKIRNFVLASMAAYLLFDFGMVDALSNARVAVTRQRGALTGLPSALAFRAGAEVYAGHLDQAEDLIKQAVDLSHAMGNLEYLGSIWWEGTLLAWRGNEANARRWAEDRTARRGTAGLDLIRYSLLPLELGLGRYQVALEIATTASKAEPVFLGSRILPNLIEAAVRAGDPDSAEAGTRRLSVLATAGATPLGLGLVARSRALLADDNHAEVLYKEAIDRLTNAAVPPELARSHLLYGEWLRRQNRRRDAREQLRVAHEMFSSMGIGAFAERARGELLATGERARRRSVETQSQLSPQEAQIARLAAKGIRNQEIGSQLFISDRTVEYHLAKVFRKLGVRSRTQLAAHPEMVGAAAARYASLPRS
ncbi:MAG TPA: AAA family ATPase [Candidatus Dormibacteraeota bacterium]|nr:AAA family ATPase [Candidatus Dormibacteraeota bacterium]